MKTFITSIISLMVLSVLQAQSDFKYVYNVSNYTEVNTRHSELALIEFGQDGQILVSDRGLMDKKKGWMGKAPFNLYSRENKEDFEIMTPKLNSDFNDGPLTASKEGTILFITTTNKTGKIDPKTKKIIYRLNISKAEFKNGKWEVSVMEELTDPSYSFAHPCLSSDGETLYFVSDKPGGFGATDIYKCGVSGGEIISYPENLDSTINTQYEEQFPYYHKNGYLFFSSRRKGGQGGLDIYYSKKKSYHEWSEALPMGKEINTQAHESSIYLNDDMTEGYFTSNRIGGKGSDDIYLLKEVNQPKETLVKVETLKQEKNEVLLENLDQQAASKTKTKKNTAALIQKVEEEKETPKPVSVEKPKRIAGKIVPPKANEHPVAVIEKVEKSEKVAKLKIVESAKAKPITKKAAEKSNVIIPNPKPLVEEHKPVLKAAENEHAKLEKKIIDEKINNVYFNSGSTEISNEAQEIIKQLSEILQEHESSIIELHAHTDAKGNFSANVQLSEKRARAVMNALNLQGISFNRMRYLAYGETDLVIKSKEEAKLNRRVEFKIIDPEANNGNADPDLFNTIRNNWVLDKNCFYVQIAATNKSKTINYFNLKDFGVPVCYVDKGLYKYVMGSYKTFSEANVKLKEIEENFPGVFIYLNVK